MKGWLNLNGELIEEHTPVIRADNRAFRYGDGLFETMRVVMGKILLRDLHFERLFRGMELLQIRVQGLINAELMEEQIFRTIKKNRLTGPVRVRLTMFRGDGGLYEFSGNHAGYVIQVWPLSASSLELNENGLSLGLYEDIRKTTDRYSNLKTNNFLVYVMGAIHTKQHRFNDSAILNTHGRISDTTIANIFWEKEGKIFTPPLSEGGVAGVMRAHLLQRLPEEGFEVEQQAVTPDELAQAGEIFVTNAVNGLRWVKTFQDKTFGNAIASKIFYATR